MGEDEHPAIDDRRVLSTQQQRLLFGACLGIVACGTVLLVRNPDGWGASVAFSGYVLGLVTRWFRLTRRVDLQSRLLPIARQSLPPDA